MYTSYPNIYALQLIHEDNALQFLPLRALQICFAYHSRTQEQALIQLLVVPFRSNYK